MSCSLEQKIRSKVKNTKYNTKSAANSKCQCAPDLCIHVSFACNQQLAHCRETTSGSEMQSGKLVTRTENQKQSSKTEHNTKSAANSKYKCAHVLCIHVSFARRGDLLPLGMMVQCCFVFGFGVVTILIIFCFVCIRKHDVMDRVM